ncbi:peptidylprolyl isomerase [Aurantiacibacter hainanensis]|uniref:peptidylprolyl isomerase n=1 Tax=Aurantiacibacter hainanensis TaxID=3076114 RepID=UPI0030C6AEF0
MISFFRKFFQSKIGVGVTLAFLGLIAIAFASSDVANTGMFGGVTGGDRVAVVGDRRISTNDLSTNANNALQQARAQDPTLTMEGFFAQGGLDEVLDQMISRAAIAEFARSLGLRAGNRLVDSEIVNIPAFQGLDGSFSADAFREALRRQGLTESTVRDDLAMGLYARQLVLPIGYGAALPDSLTRRYAQLINDTRIGSAAALTAAAFAPEGEPSQEQLQEYYQANRSDYIRPERRTLRYVTFDIEAVGDLPAITDEQIARRYQRDAQVYSASQQRDFTQLVVPTEAAAQAVIDEVRGGVSLEASAQSKGLSTVSLTDQDRQAFASQTSEDVAEEAFEASQGTLVGPVRGELGWYVLRVDNVTRVSGRTLEQASDSIREQLQEERRRLALNELTEQLEDDFADGRSLSEAAEQLGLEISTTPPITADGRIYGTQESVPAELSRVVDFAFQMEEGSDPALTEIVPGEQFLMFEVSQVTRSAAAPLAEIRSEVTEDWRRDRGMAAAAAAASRILERVEGGATLAEAVAAEEVDLPAPEPLRINRRQLAEQGQLSRASLLFFSMAEGTAKRVRVPEANTWFVMSLDEIQTADVDEGDPVVVSTRQQLAQAAGEEYLQQFLAGAEETFEVEINQTAVDAVRAQLTGSLN